MIAKEISNRILVVEDSPSVRMMARAAIEQLGLSVSEASTGAEALDCFEREEIGLVLLDVELPDLDGFEIARRIRSHDRGRDLPIIMLTSRNDLASIERAFAVGATDFASKPVSWRILGQRLLFALESARRRVEILAQREALEDLQRFANIGNWTYLIDEQRLEFSSIARDIFEIPPEGDLLEYIRSRTPAEEFKMLEAAVVQLLRSNQPVHYKHHLATSSGEERVVYTYAVKTSRQDSDLPKIEGYSQDISLLEQAESRVRYLAQHDPLTGLKNQSFFRETLSLMLAQQKRDGASHALLLLDLDHFSRINEGRGREVGDVIIRTVAERLLEVVRDSDLVMAGGPLDASVARFGGDEFSIVLARMSGATDIARVAERVLEAVRAPIALGSEEIVVTARIGIAIAPADGTEVGVLLANATAANRHARDAGGNAYVFYQASMNESARSRLGLETDFRQALLRKEVLVYFQPRVDMSTGIVAGAEVLSRWHHAQSGWVPPMEFVQIAEESGLNFELGRNVIEAAMGQLWTWRLAGYEPIPVSINVSPTLLTDERLPDLLQEVMTVTGTPPHLIEIEITETVLLRREEAAEAALGKLKALGLSIALDDFGTGYSALTHLQRFPVDVIKIDRSFINALDTERGRAIVRGVISMAHAMHLRVVAEGVETMEQRAFLAAEGCDEEQGYLISKPVPASEFEGLFWPEGVAPIMADFDADEEA